MTCPYEWGSLCKHAVAALLAYFKEPDRVQKRPDLEEILAPLDRYQLQAIVLELAERDPGIAERIEALALQDAAGAPGPRGHPAAARKELPPVDPELVEQQLQEALRSQRGRGRRYDYYAAVEEAVEVLQATARRSRPYLAAGDGRGALVFLAAVAEHATANIEDLLGDEGLELGELCEELGKLLAEAFLTAELSPQERREWVKKVGVWEARAGDYGYDRAFEIARHAAERGWDYPPLQRVFQRVLRGEITKGGAWEGEAPDCAEALAEVRLGILERQGRWDEYLHLAEAEGLTERYVSALVRLGRIRKAVEYGLNRLADRKEALTLSRALDVAGAPEDALRVGEHALSHLDAEPYPSGELPRWTRDRWNGSRGPVRRQRPRGVARHPGMGSTALAQAPSPRPRHTGRSLLGSAPRSPRVAP